ncbi:DUF2612 domain-containing protein [Erwinia psidii]|uniref:DUF2612 domain-containing protein n=1 Tax=Erwinia psidii TaxID=69224 RepID=UPI00226B70F7|nr:DUF2612 domain-containing protein [Erwinia psidii]MCX8966798.1 DUF2612 domain-containing protein [Erwinia psidii]
MITGARHGIDLLLTQYRNSPNLIAYISIFLEELAEVRTALNEVIYYRRLSNAFGVQLDCIAELVGTSRVILNADPLGYFGFHNNAQAFGLDVGIFKSADDKSSGDLVLPDADFKNRIRARIVKTMGNSCIEDMLEYFDLLFGRNMPLELTEGTASVNLKYHGVLNNRERAIMGAVARDIKVSGVSLNIEDDTGDISTILVSNDYPVST